MANSHPSEKWKYLSIGLMAVLATGFIFPQAFADQMGNAINTILGIVQDIQTKVTNTNNIVTNNLDAKVSSRATPLKVATGFLVRSDLSGFDELECSSSSDYIAHVSLKTEGNGGAFIAPTETFYNIRETGYLEFGSTANNPMTFKVIATMPDFVAADITIETTQGATVQCQNS